MSGWELDYRPRRIRIIAWVLAAFLASARSRTSSRRLAMARREALVVEEDWGAAANESSSMEAMPFSKTHRRLWALERTKFG